MGLVDIDTDNQLDKESGVFTCKISGTYLFTFSGEAATTGKDYVSVYVNDVMKFVIHENNEKRALLNYTWTLKLSADDTVQLKVVGGKVFSDYDQRVYFTGSLIRAD